MRNGSDHYDVIVIGGGHAGAEAAWAAANLGANTALVTMDPAKIGVMSCNPAIGGLAKGQMVREIDALGGLMGLAIDRTGIQFRTLNVSKGPAVRGPRAQADKYRYAREVLTLLQTRQNLTILSGIVERIVLDGDQVEGIEITPTGTHDRTARRVLHTDAVVMTTGTFMRGLMHTGDQRTRGGRVGEGPAVGISAALEDMGFELGRLKTGTPPRLAAESIHFSGLERQPGDAVPTPFSDLTPLKRFPVLEQRDCFVTHTNSAIHDVIRANLDRAPMYNGQIATAGPRYCPSIEDKVVRFKDRTSHHVFLEPESLDTNEVYCNGISTSLPGDIQETVVRLMPGCEHARILRHGYAVEYDMVLPHQIDATCMTKQVEGLFLAGQINGTSGYEEAAGQGLIAGVNAVRYAQNNPLVRLGRDQAYIGVLLDDLVTKTPREPYRMFTSRAEYRLLLRADNTADRLTPLGRDWGVVDDDRWRVFQERRDALEELHRYLSIQRLDGVTLVDSIRRPGFDKEWLLQRLESSPIPQKDRDPRWVAKLVADIQYSGYIDRQQREVAKLRQQEQAALPLSLDYERVQGLRREAAMTLNRFRPATLGQASRLAGVTPADLMVVNVALNR